jgi:hypothetical protein
MMSFAIKWMHLELALNACPIIIIASRIKNVLRVPPDVYMMPTIFVVLANNRLFSVMVNALFLVAKRWRLKDALNALIRLSLLLTAFAK